MARILGLDIGPRSVRAAVVRTAFKRVEAQQYIEMPLTESPDAEDRAASLREAIRAVLISVGRAPDRVVVGLSGSEASLRVIELPLGAAKRLDEVLPFELESLLPFPIEDAVLDHQPVDKDATTLRVLTGAAPRERVAACLADLAAAGVHPRELAVGAAALDGLVPLLPELSEPGPILLLEVNASTTHLCLLRDGVCHQARTLSAGIEQVEGPLEIELKRTLSTYRANGEPDPVLAYLTGDGGSDPNASDWLAEKLGFEVRELPLPEAPGADAAVRSRFGRAAALATRPSVRSKRMDLLKGEFSPRQALGAVRQHAQLLAICGATVLASFAFSMVARWAVVDSERDALVAQLTQVSQDAFGEETDSATRARELLERGPRNRDPMPGFDAYDVLDAISGKVPEDITHNTRRLHIELDEDGHSGRFEIQGTVASVSERDRIAQLLEEHDCFRDMEKGRTTPGAGNTGLNYQLEAAIRCPGAPEPEQQRRRRRRNR